MEGVGAALRALEWVAHELALLAATGFVILGLGDIVVDLIWLARSLVRRKLPTLTVARLPPPLDDGPLVIFTPAWDESAVIGRMLAHTLATLSHRDYRIYVGCYPNDPATIAVVEAVAGPRIRIVIGPVPGPTTKADCLNRLWRAMQADEVREGRRFKAVVLHDAEDVVHPDELTVLGTMVDRHDLVQLPVVAMIHPKSPFVSGSYADEFSESHGKEMVVRGAIGAALPSAGVGCAFSRRALVAIAGAENLPFDAASLTEDYELGLKLRDLGATAAFVRVRDAEGRLVSTREYFPHRFRDAVHQKSRWMTGIALAGWDRLGWSGRLAERWMRLRDRQSLLAAFLLFCGYLSLILWASLKLAGLGVDWQSVEVGSMLVLALELNLVLLAWRVAMRFGFVTHLYGWRQGLLSIPRILTGNFIAICAAFKALVRYRTIVKGGRAEWGKTAHDFPVSVDA